MASTALSRLEGSPRQPPPLHDPRSREATTNINILSTVSSHHLVLEVGAGVVLVGAGRDTVRAGVVMTVVWWRRPESGCPGRVEAGATSQPLS